MATDTCVDTPSLLQRGLSSSETAAGGGQVCIEGLQILLLLSNYRQVALCQLARLIHPALCPMCSKPSVVCRGRSIRPLQPCILCGILDWY